MSLPFPAPRMEARTNPIQHRSTIFRAIRETYPEICEFRIVHYNSECRINKKQIEAPRNYRLSTSKEDICLDIYKAGFNFRADGYIMHKMTRIYDYVSAFVKSTPKRNIINRYEVDHNLFPIIRELHEDVRSIKASLNNLQVTNGAECMRATGAPELCRDVLPDPYPINLPTESSYPTASDKYN